MKKHVESWLSSLFVLLCWFLLADYSSRPNTKQ